MGVTKEILSHVCHGVLYREGKLLLSQNSPLRITFMEEYHNIPIGGHIFTGVTKTYSHLTAKVTWRGMKKEVTYFVSYSC